MEDLDDAGGVYAVMNELDSLGILDTTGITCTGKTIKEKILQMCKLRSRNHPSC